MELFLGCYRGDRSKWFLVWAPTRTEAINWVDCQTGEPDVDSFVQVKGPGMVDFARAEVDQEEGMFIELSQGALSIDDFQASEAAAGFLTDDPAQPAGLEDPRAADMGIQDPRVADTYAIMNGLKDWPEDDEPCPEADELD